MAGLVLHNAPVVDGLLPRGLGAEDGGNGPGLGGVRGQHLLEGEVAADIAVHHKEGVRVPGPDLVPEVVDAASRSEGRVFLKVADVDPRVLPVHLPDKARHLIGRVESEDEDLPEVGHLDTGLNVVLDNGAARHREQGLGHIQGERPEPGPLLGPCNQDDSLEQGHVFCNVENI